MLSPCADLAQHYLSKNNISALRRVRKTDNNRIARACGATIVNRTDEIKEEDVGTGCGLFEVRKIGDEYFTYLVDCKDPKACSIVLRGASKDILDEVWCPCTIACLAWLWYFVSAEKCKLCIPLSLSLLDGKKSPGCYAGRT